jgi:hypothetical protein
MVRVKVPFGVAPEAAVESMDVVVVGLGLKDPVVPAGSPLRLNVTAPVKPPLGVTVTV